MKNNLNQVVIVATPRAIADIVYEIFRQMEIDQEELLNYLLERKIKENTEREFVDAAGVSRMLGIKSERSSYLIMKRHNIRPFKFWGKIFYRIKDVTELVEQRKNRKS